MNHPGMNEKAFQRTVVELAERLGWTIMHIGASVRPLAGGQYHDDGTWTGRLVGDKESKGFPDLFLVRERIIFRELKTDATASKLSPEQKVWFERLEEARADVAVWRPRDWDTLVVPALAGYRGVRK